MTTINLPFLGRKKDIAGLKSRVCIPGLTVVHGRPGIGKSRLLHEFVEELRVYKIAIAGKQKAGEAPGDTLLRAVGDAYDHWLTRENSVALLRSKVKANKARLAGRSGEAVKAILETAGDEAKDWIPGSKTAAAIITGAFGSSKAAFDRPDSVGIGLAPIQSEEVCALLEVIADGETHPIVLVLDQWEDEQKIVEVSAALRTFLSDLANWPPAHVLIHLRDPLRSDNANQDAHTIAAGLVAQSAGRAKWFEVEPIDFLADPDDLPNLTDFLQAAAPAILKIPQEELLGTVIDGNPWVLACWHNLTSESDRHDLDRLREVAADAHAFRSPEIGRALAGWLADRSQHGVLAVALRLAAMPEASAESWQHLEEAVLGGVDPAQARMELLAARYLWRWVKSGAPEFGHPSRHETARRLTLGIIKEDGSVDELCASLTPRSGEALEQLVETLVASSDLDAGVRGDQAVQTRLGAVAALGGALGGPGSSVATRWCCAAAGTLIRAAWPPDLPPLGVPARRALPPSARRLVASGLFNAFNNSDADPERADGLLAELRALSHAHPEDAVVRERFINGLFNASYRSEADPARADDLLGELQAATEAHPDDAAVRDRLAKGLFNAIAYSGPDFDRADGLLAEFQSLVKKNPVDGTVRAPLAKAYGLSIQNARAAGDAGRAADMAEALVPLRDAVEAQPVIAGLIKKDIAAALELAIRKDDADAGRRLTAASKALFGD